MSRREWFSVEICWHRSSTVGAFVTKLPVQTVLSGLKSRRTCLNRRSHGLRAMRSNQLVTGFADRGRDLRRAQFAVAGHRDHAGGEIDIDAGHLGEGC